MAKGKKHTPEQIYVPFVASRKAPFSWGKGTFRTELPGYINCETALAAMNYRSGNHLVESYGFCHGIHHAPKAGLQLLSICAVHHSYDIVILSGSYRIDPRNWDQPQARQHLILFVPASCGKDRDTIFIARLVQERECQRSGAGCELRGNPRRETT